MKQLTSAIDTQLISLRLVGPIDHGVRNCEVYWWTTQSSSTVEQSSVSATSWGAPQHSYAQSSRLACIQQRLVGQGISETTAFHIARSQRKSTMSVYDSYWERFTTWCSGRNQDPFDSSIATIADFLTVKFREGAADGKLDESDNILSFPSQII